jgi:hypothetical protein
MQKGKNVFMPKDDNTDMIADGSLGHTVYCKPSHNYLYPWTVLSPPSIKNASHALHSDAQAKALWPEQPTGWTVATQGHFQTDWLNDYYSDQ